MYLNTEDTKLEMARVRYFSLIYLSVNTFNKTYNKAIQLLDLQSSEPQVTSQDAHGRWDHCGIRQTLDLYMHRPIYIEPKLK